MPDGESATGKEVLWLTFIHHPAELFRSDIFSLFGLEFPLIFFQLSSLNLRLFFPFQSATSAHRNVVEAIAHLASSSSNVSPLSSFSFLFRSFFSLFFSLLSFFRRLRSVSSSDSLSDVYRLLRGLRLLDLDLESRLFGLADRESVLDLDFDLGLARLGGRESSDEAESDRARVLVG